MIDPNEITNYDRSDCELMEFFLFAIVVAGKTAKTQARLLDGFIQSLPSGKTLKLRLIKAVNDDTLMSLLIESRLGQYNRLFKSVIGALSLDLRNDPIEVLEETKGVGPKTSRFFLMHSRPAQRLAALDTHILKYLRAKGVKKVPLITPSSKKEYTRLEDAFLQLADKAGKAVADYDLEVWKSYAVKRPAAKRPAVSAGLV